MFFKGFKGLGGLQFELLFGVLCGCENGFLRLGSTVYCAYGLSPPRDPGQNPGHKSVQKSRGGLLTGGEGYFHQISYKLDLMKLDNCTLKYLHVVFCKLITVLYGKTIRIFGWIFWIWYFFRLDFFGFFFGFWG